MRLDLVSLSKIVPSFGKSALVPTSIGPAEADGAEVVASPSSAFPHEHAQAAAAASVPAAMTTKSRRFRSDIRLTSLICGTVLSPISSSGTTPGGGILLHYPLRVKWLHTP